MNADGRGVPVVAGPLAGMREQHEHVDDTAASTHFIWLTQRPSRSP
jgi:hypothetical protein